MHSRFAFRAFTPDGLPEEGIIQAASADVALAMLARRGLFPVRVDVAEDDAAARIRMPSRDLALGLAALATLLEAGLPMARALSVMDQLAPRAWLPILPSLREAVREGEGLGAAFEQCGVRMPPVVLGLVRAGERGGDLAMAVRRAADVVEASAELRSALLGALLYPLVLAAAGAASVAILVGVVIPRFAEILSDLGQGLPPATAAVMSAALLARVGALPAAVALAMIFALWRSWVATEPGRARWHDFLLGTPVVGAARLSSGTAAIAASLSALLQSGVAAAPAMAAAAGASGDAALERRVLAARESVLAGASMSRGLGAASAVTETAVQLIRLGEESGEVPRLLAQVARLERARAEHMVRAAVRLLEPALVILFAGIVALVAAALLQAVYAVRPAP